MTPYEQGFMDKCAELGVDPAALVKRAGLFRLLSADLRPAARAAKRGGRRFAELLAGGSQKAHADYANGLSRLDAASTSLRDLTRDMTRGKYTSSQWRQALSQLADDTAASLRPFGSEATQELSRIRSRIAKFPRSIDDVMFQDVLDASRRAVDSVHDEELAKVLAARLGLAGGVGAAGYGTYKAVSGGEEGK